MIQKQGAHLTPDQHSAEYYLQTIKEVISDYDDCGSTSCPTFTRADRFYTRGSCVHKRIIKAWKPSPWSQDPIRNDKSCKAKSQSEWLLSAV